MPWGRSGIGREANFTISCSSLSRLIYTYMMHMWEHSVSESNVCTCCCCCTNAQIHTNTCSSYCNRWYSREFPNPNRTLTLTEIWLSLIVGVVLIIKRRGPSAIGRGRNCAVSFSEKLMFTLDAQCGMSVHVYTWGTGLVTWQKETQM